MLFAPWASKRKPAVSIELRQDRRQKIAEAIRVAQDRQVAWIQTADEAVGVMQSLKQSLVPLLHCGQDHHVLLESYGGLLDDLKEISRHSGGNPEAIRTLDSIADRVSDLMKLNRQIRTQIDISATLVEKAVNDMHDGLIGRHPALKQ